MDRDNRSEARGDTEMIPIVPFLCKKVRLRWRGVTATKASQRHEGLTLFSGNPRHEGLGYSSTYGDSLRQEPGPLQASRGTHPQLYRRLPRCTPQNLTMRKLGEDLTKKCTQALGEKQIALVDL